MANKKISLVYYSVDTDRYQDARIKRLKRKYKGDGVSVYDYILCEIYRVLGCYIVWDEEQLLDVAEYWNLDEALVTEIVHYCVSIGLFNVGIFAEKCILTSFSIQTRYLSICKNAKRTGVLIPAHINLIHAESMIIPNNNKECSIIQEECDIIHEECGNTEGSLPCSIVKNSIVKNSIKKKRENSETEIKNYLTEPEPENTLWFLKFYHGGYDFYKKIFNGLSTTENYFKSWQDFISIIYEKKYTDLFRASMVNPHDFENVIKQDGFTRDLWEPVIEAMLQTGILPSHNLRFRIKLFINIVQEKNAKNGKFNRSSGSGNGKEIKFDKP